MQTNIGAYIAGSALAVAGSFLIGFQFGYQYVAIGTALVGIGLVARATHK